MQELVVHARDEQAGEVMPVYSVLVRGDQACVLALHEDWEGPARQLEAQLNQPQKRRMAAEMPIL